MATPRKSGHSIYHLTDVKPIGWIKIPNLKHDLFYIQVLLCRHTKAGKLDNRVFKVPVKYPYVLNGKTWGTEAQFQKLFKTINNGVCLIKGDVGDYYDWCEDVSSLLAENDVNIAICWADVEPDKPQIVWAKNVATVEKRVPEFVWPKKKDGSPWTFGSRPVKTGSNLLSKLKKRVPKDDPPEESAYIDVEPEEEPEEATGTPEAIEQSILELRDSMLNVTLNVWYEKAKERGIDTCVFPDSNEYKLDFNRCINKALAGQDPDYHYTCVQNISEDIVRCIKKSVNGYELGSGQFDIGIEMRRICTELNNRKVYHYDEN